MKNLNCLVGEIIIIYFYLSKINLMKKILILSSLLITFLLFPNKIHAQFWKKIQDKVEKKAEDVTDDILNGSDTGKKADIVILNAAAGIFVGGKAGNLQEGISTAREVIRSGSAMNILQELTEV